MLKGNELVAMSFVGKDSQPVISAISIPAGSLRDEKGLAAQIPNPKTPGVGAGEVAAQVPLNGVQGVIGMDFTLPVAAPDSADPTGNSPDTLKFFYAEINGNTPGNRVKVVRGASRRTHWFPSFRQPEPCTVLIFKARCRPARRAPTRSSGSKSMPRMEAR